MPYLCLVHVLSGGPDGGPPLHPSHPIMLPGMPGWGGGGPVDPGYSPPWARPRPPGQGGGPVDPGYSPPWAQAPVDPGYGFPIGGRPGGGGGPVDPGYSPPWARPGTGPVDPGYGIDAGLRPTHPIYNPAYPDNTLPAIPPQQPIVVDGKAHIVAYIPNPDKPSGYERITFTVEVPEASPPTEAQPK
jgi:hypothetical protein